LPTTLTPALEARILEWSVKRKPRDGSSHWSMRKFEPYWASADSVAHQSFDSWNAENPFINDGRATTMVV
jgi:hypothetical protein